MLFSKEHGEAWCCGGPRHRGCGDQAPHFLPWPPHPFWGARAGGHAQWAFWFDHLCREIPGVDSGRAGGGRRLFLCGFRGVEFLLPKSRAEWPRRGLGWAGGPAGVAGLVGRRAQGWLDSAPHRTPRFLHLSDEPKFSHWAGICGSVVPWPWSGQLDGDEPRLGGTAGLWPALRGGMASPPRRNRCTAAG